MWKSSGHSFLWTKRALQLPKAAFRDQRSRPYGGVARRFRVDVKGG